MEDKKQDSKHEEINMYFVLAPDLSMTKGKMTAQIAHAAIKLDRLALGHLFGVSLLDIPDQIARESPVKIPDWTSSPENTKQIKEWYSSWLNKSYPKIVLKAKESEFEALKKDADVTVLDEGENSNCSRIHDCAGFFTSPQASITPSNVEIKTPVIVY